MTNNIIQRHRRPLLRLRQALASGTVRLGFIGGSITDARPRYNWPEPVIVWLTEAYPHVRLYVENAAIGATGSELAVFRAERDLIDRGCDIVFIDYAVNDHEEPKEQRMRTREGLLRKLLQDGSRDVVWVHTFCQSFYRAMAEGGVPESITELEALAEHYQTGSVWMGLHAMDEVRRGQLRWEEWLPDGLHPTERGSLSYAQSVIAFLQAELSEEQPLTATDERHELPEPLNPRHWGEAHSLALSDIQVEGPWVTRRWPHVEWIDQVLETAAIGARLSFHFVGRGLSLGFDFGKYASEFRYRLDHGDWVTVSRSRPDWCPDDGWYRMYGIADDLPAGTHHFELEVIHGDTKECRGTNCRLALVGIVP
ncbi:SGNH/GDSL hydrolase family protein [Paenibacillus ferrarius]|uniref:SGNH/GDSL hydrolase family protein n=1 Tax=Paenibacillus ferrarius TaxID=1469647 RepID=UPI003D29D97A